MSFGPLALLLVGQIAVHVEDARGIEDQERARLVETFGAALGAASGARSVVSDQRCADAARCTDEIREKTGASDVVHVRLIGVPTRIRVVAERASADAGPLRRAQADLTRDAASWRRALDGVALVLFPAGDPAARAAVPEAAPPVAPEKAAPSALPAAATAIDGATPAAAEPSFLPWVVLGGSAVALGLGVVFGIQAKNATEELQSPPFPERPELSRSDQQNQELQDSEFSNGLAANLLFGTAALGVATGVVLLVLEDP